MSYWGRVNVFKLILRPFPFFLSPVVWLGFFVYGLTTVWLVVLSICSSIIFGAPPYHFDATQTGLTSIGPLVGSIPATIIAGPLCDYIATWMARANGGTFEPEFRLTLIFPSFLLEFFGFIGWAVITQKNEGGANIHWIGPVMSESHTSPRPSNYPLTASSSLPRPPTRLPVLPPSSYEVYTLINIGQSVLSTAIIAYLIDCHRGHTGA